MCRWKRIFLYGDRVCTVIIKKKGRGENIRSLDSPHLDVLLLILLYFVYIYIFLLRERERNPGGEKILYDVYIQRNICPSVFRC